MVLSRDKKNPRLLNALWFTIRAKHYSLRTERNIIFLVATNLNSMAAFLFFGREPPHPHGLLGFAEKKKKANLRSR